MQSEMENMHKYGLVGRDIAYSFSRQYFSEKFEALGLENHSYENFDIASINDFLDKIKPTEGLKGLNVTIPYKEEIIPFLDELDEEALKIGAINTVKISEKGRLKGFNTDVYGFENALKPLLKKHHDKALILGTGGASKAVHYVLEKFDITVLFVSRNPQKEGQIAYKDLSKKLLKEYNIIINCTPLGTFPEVERCPNVPFRFLDERHLLYDLIYNPSETRFLKKGKKMGCTVSNGEKMLQLQAEKAWRIWNS